MNAYKLFNYVLVCVSCVSCVCDGNEWGVLSFCLSFLLLSFFCSQFLFSSKTYLGMVDSRVFFVHSVHCMSHHHSMASDYCNFVYVFGQSVIVPGIDIRSTGSMHSSHHSLKWNEIQIQLNRTTEIHLIKTNAGEKLYSTHENYL